MKGCKSIIENTHTKTDNSEACNVIVIAVIKVPAVTINAYFDFTKYGKAYAKLPIIKTVNNKAFIPIASFQNKKLKRNVPVINNPNLIFGFIQKILVIIGVS